MVEDEVRRAFVDLCSDDAEFVEALASAPSMSHAVAIAAERGFDVDADVLRAALSGVSSEGRADEALSQREKPAATDSERLRY
jgi:hypothetical protein